MDGPFLEIHEAGTVRQMLLGDNPLTIGRHGDNRLPLIDNMASRFHCHISRSPNGAVMLRDLNSSNGTAVNGRLVKYTRLMPGDTVTIGHTKMVFIDPTAGEEEHGRRAEIVELGRPNPLPANRPHSGNGVDTIQHSMELLPLDEPEELTEDDIVPDDNAAITSPMNSDEAVNISMYEVPENASSYASGNNGPISTDDLIAMDDNLLISTANTAGDAREAVEALVQSLPDQTFGENDIALFSARGKLVHAAGGPGRGGPRESNETVEWFRLLLLLSCRSHATDIHFEPKGEEYLLRMRVDGTMVEICRISNATGIRLSALVKVLGEIDIAQKNSIQEGHFSAQVPRARRGDSPRIDYRVSFAPSVYGQKLVIRVLDTAYAPLQVRNLQLPNWMADEVERVIRRDAGMVLACGPTGSGKTTTLYALIRGSGVSQRNVVTIEDPVEIQLEGVTQIPVDEGQNKSFSDLLRSTLRQDPDVILIGEIRDAETARIAMQAAITGHLVFSTVHSQDTIGTIFRLLDLGVEPYLVSQALHLVLAQRLVRQLCPTCRTPVAPTGEQLKKMGANGNAVKRIYEPRGCVQCLNTGFSGRRAIFELLSASEKLRELITRTAAAGEIQAALASTPFQRLQISGYELVARGLTPFSEIERVVGGN